MKYKGVYFKDVGKRKLVLTKSLDPNITFFDEGHKEFRIWDPRRSKLCTAIFKKVRLVPLKEGDNVLYLGASHGYTPTFVSDLVGIKGMVFCLDFAPRVVRDLYFVCEERDNMCPIMADANKPDLYLERVPKVDVVYQDIAQRNQVGIFLKNFEKFGKNKAYGMLAIKCRSIDVTKSPRKIILDVERQLKNKVKIIDIVDLNPLQKDHYFLVVQKR